MLPRHWVMLGVAIVVGMFLQKYWNPLSYVPGVG